mgnify:CR=1 FL=1
MSAPNRKITPVQLFSVLFLSRLFASMTYIAGLDRDLQPGETVAAMLYASAFIVIACVCEAVFLKNDDGVGILMRAKSASNKFFVFTDVFYLVFFLAYCALAAARFNLFVNSIIFPDSDMSWFVLPVIAGCACIAYKGIESVSRSSVLFTFIVVLSLVFVFAAAATRFDVLNFRGVRPGKGTEIFETGFMSAVRTAEVASIPILTPFLNGSPTKPMFKWTGVTAVSLILISSMISGVLGQFGYEQIFPMYSLTVLAEFGVLERLDAIITAVWVLCFIAKMSYFLFVNSYLLKELTPIERKYSPFVCAVPVGIGAMMMSKNVDVLAVVIKSGFLTVLFIGGGIVIPITVVICEKIRQNKRRTEVSR